MINAGSYHRQSKRNVDARIKVQCFERYQSLVVVHADVAIGGFALPRQERCVRRKRTPNIHALLCRGIDRGKDQVFFFPIAEQAAFARMGTGTAGAADGGGTAPR